MNKDLSCTFISPKWEAKNTYLVMPIRRIFGGFTRLRRGSSAIFLEGLAPIHKFI